MAQSRFSYTISLTASSEAEATRKVKAATTLCAKLTDKELTALAAAVQDPTKVKVAKQFLGIV